MKCIAHASDPPSPWAGFQLCLRDLPDCSHVLTIQSDAVPCRNFAPAVEQIAAANSDTPVCLFLARLPRDASAEAAKAMQQGRRYVTLSLRSFLPVVCVLWPRFKAVEFMDWAEANPGLPGQREPRSDDAMAGRWKTVRREVVRASVPSLVQHPDMEPSLIGRRAMWGKDAGRVAAFLADDALEFDWTGM